jgi:hypothetical protein
MKKEKRGPELLEDFFEDKAVFRPPFMLWSTSLGPRVIKRSVMEQLSDPGLIATNVTRCFNLFSPDAIIMGFPDQFPLGACELSKNPVSVELDQGSQMYTALFEGVTRIGLALKNQIALSVSLPGPVAFREQIKQSLSIPQMNDTAWGELLDGVAEILSKLTSSLLELDISLITFIENLEALHRIDNLTLTKINQLADTLSNIVSYHNKHMIMAVNDIPVDKDHLTTLEKFDQFDAFLIDHKSCPQAFQGTIAVGVTVPAELFNETVNFVEQRKAHRLFMEDVSHRASPLFLSTHQEISDQFSLAALRAFREAIK